MAKKAGVETEIFIMVGFPGETEREFKKTYTFIKRNAQFIDTIKSINTLHLIAGTDIYERPQAYNLKPLPKENWHYLWETYSGNNYAVRKERVNRVLDLASCLGIKVMETNIKEGKECTSVIIDPNKSLQEKLSLLRDSLSSLQELPAKKINIRAKRSILRWIVLLFVSSFTIFYIVHFWCFMLVRDRVLLGGRKK
jgi:hypothetical protein